MPTPAAGRLLGRRAGLLNVGQAGAYVLLPNGRPGPKLVLQQVPEPKVAKNRCHVDLVADSHDAVSLEVDRLVALGATVLRPPKEEFGAYWATLQDPEGNELCLAAA